MAFVERFVQSIKQECLDYFVVFGKRHMDYLCQEFSKHYHAERLHQGLENALFASRRKERKRQPDMIPLADVARRKRLGGP
jgi:putative transposase